MGRVWNSIKRTESSFDGLSYGIWICRSLFCRNQFDNFQLVEEKYSDSEKGILIRKGTRAQEEAELYER